MPHDEGAELTERIVAFISADFFAHFGESFDLCYARSVHLEPFDRPVARRDRVDEAIRENILADHLRDIERLAPRRRLREFAEMSRRNRRDEQEKSPRRPRQQLHS